MTTELALIFLSSLLSPVRSYACVQPTEPVEPDIWLCVDYDNCRFEVEQYLEQVREYNDKIVEYAECMIDEANDEAEKIVTDFNNRVD